MRLAAALLASAQGQVFKPKRLLVVRPDHLGDLLFLSPALHWLRQQLSDTQITLAIAPWAKPALPALAGAFDELEIIPFPAFARGGGVGWFERWRMLLQVGRQWRQQHYDTALIFRPDHWWGAVASALAHIPQRWGYATAETSPWLTHTLALPHEHAAASNLRLAQSLLNHAVDLDPQRHPLRFTLDPDLRQESETLLRTQNYSPKRPLVLLHPGAGAAVKCWEVKKWGRVAHHLQSQGATVYVTGGPGEEALTAQVVAASEQQAIDLGGRTSFSQLAALMQHADLVLGVDSGPLHLAVAVGTPTIHLFGPADPVRFGPWGDAARHLVIPSSWACAPCEKLDWTDVAEHACVRDIPVDAVIQAAEHLLSLAST
ncbi:MAG: glycosyltransferase family 9 protein [Chloroflexi bacterium]|nr:glycosyltransferase family 9 protein [Chloroflexota bacterium]